MANDTALGANTYGKVEDVQRMVGELAQGRKFANYNQSMGIAGTNPSLDEVYTALNRAADLMNARLAGLGYSVPISDSYSHVKGWAREVNSALASARLLASQPTKEVDVVGGEDEANSRIGFFVGQANDFFAALESGLIGLPLATTSGSRVGYPEPRDPIFTLGMLEL